MLRVIFIVFGIFIFFPCSNLVLYTIGGDYIDFTNET